MLDTQCGPIDALLALCRGTSVSSAEDAVSFGAASSRSTATLRSRAPGSSALPPRAARSPAWAESERHLLVHDRAAGGASRALAMLAVIWTAGAVLPGCGARTQLNVPCVIALYQVRPAVLFLIEWAGTEGPYTPRPTYLFTEQDRVAAAMYAVSYAAPALGDVPLIGAMVSQTIRYGDQIPDAPDGSRGPGWCAPTTALGIPIGENHGSELMQYLTSELIPAGQGQVLADLPFVESQLLAAGGAHTPRFVILIDDGNHGCPGPDGLVHITPSDFSAIEAQFAVLVARGIRTIVIGMTPQDLSLDDFETEPGFSVMNAEAQGGGVQRPDAPPFLYYDFADQAAVTSVLQSTIVRPYWCMLYAPAGTASGRDADLIAVSGGRSPARDTTRTNGWDWTDEARGQITLFGPACDAAVNWHQRFEIVLRGAVC